MSPRYDQSVDHSNCLPTPTVHSWHTATTLSEDVGSRPEVSIIIYQGSSSCRDVEKQDFYCNYSYVKPKDQ